MTDKSLPSQTLPRSGHVRKLRQEWVVKEDQVLAENLQDEELKTHIGKVQKKHSIIREDSLHARIEQSREDELAATSIKTKEQILAEQEYKDYLFAQELEKQEREAQENEKRERKASNGVPENKLLKITPKGNTEEEQRRNQLEKDAELSRKLQSLDMQQRGKSKLDNTEEERRRIQLEQDAELSRKLQSLDMKQRGKPKLDKQSSNTDVEQRRIQLEQDAELSRKLQSLDMKQRGKPKMYKQSDIEAKDYELAKMLQDQENARLREIQRNANPH